MRSFQLSTRSRDEFVDITAQVRQIVVESGVQRGVCLIACPHTTAGIAVQEGYDPDVARDMLAALARLFPREGDYRHAEGNSDAHLKSAFVGSSQMLPIENNALQ